MAADGELLLIEPQDLQFPFELQKQISCSLQLTNNSNNFLGFKVKTTNPKKYCVRPNTGILTPKSTCDVTVTMQAQTELPSDLQCKDKFLVQCIVVSGGAAVKDLTSEMFNKEAGNPVEEWRLRVLYAYPVTDEGSPLASGQAAAATHKFDMPSFESEDGFSKEMFVISKLREEKLCVVEQNSKLRQELERLRRAGRSSRGIPLVYVFAVGMLGIVVGYLLKT